MNYFKNADLARQYGVRKTTIANWIKQTRSGRLDLDLVEKEGDFYIAKTAKNQLVMDKVVKDRRKFNHNLTTIQPKPEFYEVYTEEQVLDIIDWIDIEGEIPRQYNYLSGGAEYWDRYAKRLEEEDAPNLLRRTIELVDNNLQYLDTLLAPYKHVNVIDIGVGNAAPTRGLLKHLLEIKKLKRYVAIDISQRMLDIAQQNINQWFNDDPENPAIRFEGYVDDISYEPFRYATINDTTDGVNLVLLLGGTLSNFHKPGEVLNVIRRSMGREDFFIYTVKLDSPTTRQHFDFRVVGSTHEEKLPPQYKYIVDLLGIKEEYYSVESGWDEQENARYLQIKLNRDLTINFEIGREMRSVDLRGNDKIIIWRYEHNSSRDIQDLLEENGFKLLLTAQTSDHNYMITIANRKKKRQ